MKESSEDKLQAAIELGKREWIKAYLHEHLHALDADRSPQAWEVWNAAFRRYMAEDREPPLPEPKQQKPVFTLVRKAVMLYCGLDESSPLMQRIGLTPAEHTAINYSGKQKLTARKQKPLSTTQIDAIVAKADELLDSNDWAEIVCGLSVATGRRLAEVLLTAKLKPCKTWSVIFSGQLKTGGTLYDEEFEIPTLLPADRLLNAIARLRELKPLAPPDDLLSIDKIAEWVNANHVKAVKDATNKHFDGLIPPREEHGDDLYSRLYRVIYATIAHYWFGCKDIHKHNFLAYIQGHRDRSVDRSLLASAESAIPLDLAAARSYDDYYPADADGKGFGPDVAGVRLHEAGIEPIDWIASTLDLQTQQAAQAKAAQVARDNKRPRKRASLSADQFDRLLALCAKLGFASDDMTSADVIEHVLVVAEAALEGSDTAQTIEAKPDPKLAAELAELQAQVEARSQTISALQVQQSTLQQQNQTLQANLDEALATIEQLRSQPETETVAPVSDNSLSQQLAALAKRVEAIASQQEQQQADFTAQLELALSQQQEQFQHRQQQAMALLMGSPLPTASTEAPSQAHTPVEAVEATAPKTPKVSASTPPGPSPSRKTSDSYLDTQELVTAILKFNEAADDGDRWFIATKLIADLLKVNIKDRNQALNDLQPAIDSHHQQFDLNHTANRTNRLIDLVAWLQLHFPDLRLRDEFYDD